MSVQWVMIANALTLGILTVIRLYRTKSKNQLFPVYMGYKYRILLGILTGVTALSFIISLVLLIITALKESSGVSFEYLRALLPMASAFLLVPVLAVITPKLCPESRKAVIFLVSALTLIGTVIAIFPVTPYKITSDPMVIDNGSEYSVVFATSDEGTGYVNYSFNGKEYKLYDEAAGRLVKSKLHSITVPYEHLKSNKYKVGSTRVIDEYSYGSRLGKEVVSVEYPFTVNDGFLFICRFFALSTYLCTPSGRRKRHSTSFLNSHQLAKNKFFDKLKEVVTQPLSDVFLFYFFFKRDRYACAVTADGYCGNPCCIIYRIAH